MTSYFNVCKSYIYAKISQEIQQEYYNEKDNLNGNLEDKADLRGKIYYIATTNNFFETLTEHMPQKKLLANKSLSVLKKKWFSSHGFPTDISHFVIRSDFLV